MEPVSLALGVAPIAATLLSACFTGYRYLSELSSVGEEAQVLLCRLKIEENRLRLWAEDIETQGNGSLDQQLDERHVRGLAVLILANTCTLFTNLKKLRSEYGLTCPNVKASEKQGLEADFTPALPSLPSLCSMQGASTPAPPREMLSKYAEQIKKTLSSMQKLKFVLRDKQKFGAMLEQLRYFNDSLISLLPPPRRVRLQLTLSSKILEETDDLHRLSRIKEASQDKDSSLSSTAMMKRWRIEMERPSQKFISASELRCRLVDLKLDDALAQRSIGTYEKTGAVTKVLAEWKYYDRSLPRELSVERIQDIARYLHATSNCRSPDLPVPECIGYVEDVERPRCCLLYKLSGDVSAPLATLADLIPCQFDPAKTPNLEYRLGLARALSVALFRLHLTGWLHKGIRNSNIAFLDLGKGDDPSFITRPTLLGFDYSRPNQESVESDRAPRLLEGYDPYTHPEYQSRHCSEDAVNSSPSATNQRRYKPAYDIYSFGLVLIEIALWQQIGLSAKKAATPEQWQERIRKVVRSELGHVVGGKYQAVVTACLDWHLRPRTGDDFEGNADEFLKHVVDPLHECP
jgi:hypothetical protein